MQSKVSKLIADIERAEKALFNIISQEDEPDPDHLVTLDGTLEQSFNLLLSTQLNAPQQRVERIRYLLYRIEKHADCSKLLSTMTATIMDDVMFVLADSKQVNSGSSQTDYAEILEHSFSK